MRLITQNERSQQGERQAQGEEEGAAVVESSGAGSGLGKRAIRGSLWTLGGYGASQLLRLISNLILTRLLFPEAFGLMALVSALLMGLTMFSDLGLAPSIVQSKRGDERDFLATAWTLQILRGMLLTIGAMLLAGPISRFYGDPQLQNLWLAAALTVLISGFNSTAIPRLQRHVEVRKLISLELAAQVVSLVVMIAWAYNWRSVWALLAGSLAAATVKMIGSHLIDPARRDRLGWDTSAVREIFAFGKWIFVSTILTFCVGQADRLIFGKLVTLPELGVYSIAATLAAIPMVLISRIGNSVVFPTFSRAFQSGADFRPIIQRTRNTLLALGGFPVVVLLASAVPLVEILYDSRYAGAGGPLQILAVGAWLRMIELPSGSALLAWGLPRKTATASGVMLAGIVVLLPLGWHLGGFQGAIAGFVSAEALRYAWLASAAMRRGAPACWKDGSASIWLAVAAAGGIQAASLLGAEASDFERLAVSALASSGIWALGAVAIMGRDARSHLGRLIARSPTQ